MRKRWGLALALGLVAGLSVACPKEAAWGGGEGAFLEQLARWQEIPESELETLWEEAQGSGGVLAVEPGSSVVGPPAAVKKTWAVADQFLRYFVYGNQPNWFPADVIRRTTCGSDPRWSYFWHGLSGFERDLHPWLGGPEGFSDLLGARAAALLAGDAVSLAPCDEVGMAGSGCLYGEVTPPAGFDTWFCGGPRRECRAFFQSSQHELAPPDLQSPEALCMHGPFVLERVHEWRPEIHPAEVMWVRKARAEGFWTFVLAPDRSRRFDKERYFEKDGRDSTAAWERWSRSRVVELWVAFAADSNRPVVFDLAAKTFRERPAPAGQITLTPPAPGGEFVRLPASLDGVFSAARVWTDDSGRDHGFVVLRTAVRADQEEAMVLRLRGRSPEEDPPAAELETVRLPEVVAPEAVPEPAAVRLFGLATVGDSAVPGAVAINTLVRFDPGRPARPEDEEAAHSLNQAVSGCVVEGGEVSCPRGREDSQHAAAMRLEVFGAEKPFRVEWDISATRDDTGAPVPVRVRAPVAVGGSSSQTEVQVAPFPGPATERIDINDAIQLEALAEEEALVSLGQLLLSTPDGVTVTGDGHVFVRVAGGEPAVFSGRARVEDGEPAVTVRFRYPPRSYTKEWELVEDVLLEIHAPDSTLADQRLQKLQEDACALAASVPCGGRFLSAEVEGSLADPTARWPTLRELEEGDRSFARFVWLFERGLRWDGIVTEDERERMMQLLAPGHDPSPGD